MKIDTYKTLTYEEDERINNPISFHNNGKGNRRVQHVIISDKSQVADFLAKYDLSGISDEKICLSILWNFPRKEYSEKTMWVTISGFTYNVKKFIPKAFVISDNIVTEESQILAQNVIDTLNSYKGIEIDYAED